MNRHFTTSKGTELPLLNLRGKDYLEVKYRIVWFREEHPNWSIETNFLTASDKAACAKAIVRDENSRVIATSHKSENVNGFPDFLEKAETGAIGRALALIGYGTQFCADELDEGDRIVDAPVTRHVIEREPSVLSASSTSQNEKYVVNFGKYRGRHLSDIPREELSNYLIWLRTEAEKKNSALSVEAAILTRMAELYFEKLDAKKEKAAEPEELKQAS